MKRSTLCLAILLLAGCSTITPGEKTAPQVPPQVVSSPYSTNSIQNLYIGRQYVAEKRYELAKEYFLLALASAENETMREQLVTEITSVNRLLETLR
ncbi:MAG: hypothetical protein MI749_04890 [Desulfovibrionales bacterium]|nr:hypothetical protein [Desulfovibrionales bacterium]